MAHGKGAEKMRRLMVVALVVLAGCRSVTGPFQQRKPERVDDPSLPIAEQERRGRDRLALPNTSPTMLPRLYGESETPSPNSR
jgi:hypothetical protein